MIKDLEADAEVEGYRLSSCVVFADVRVVAGLEVRPKRSPFSDDEDLLRFFFLWRLSLSPDVVSAPRSWPISLESELTIAARSIWSPNNPVDAESVIDRDKDSFRFAVTPFMDEGIASSNNNLNDLFPVGAFKGESSMNDELASAISFIPFSRSPLLSSLRGPILANGRDMCEPLVRRFFSLLGVGDTGSPRRRFLALDTVSSERGCKAEDVDGMSWKGSITGSSSGDASRVEIESTLPLDAVGSG